MHHDARIYVEMRYDSDSCDVVIVHFRDRGILPVEAKTWEYTLDSPVLGDDLQMELVHMVNQLWNAVYNDK